MLQPPAFSQKFGNVKIKIRSYSKHMLKSILIGMKENYNSLHKITNVTGFKHSFNELGRRCNCKDNIEDLCMKFAINVHRYGKVFIPLEILDFNSPEHEVFLCELKSVHEQDCLSKKINIELDCGQNNNCLLKLATKTKLAQEKFNENPPESSYSDAENCNSFVSYIKQLVRNGNPSKDVKKVLDLCSKFNIPPQEILTVLRNFNLQKQKAIKTGKDARKLKNCENYREKENIDKCYDINSSIFTGNNNRGCGSSNSPYKHTRHFKITRTPSPNTFSPSCNDDYDSEYSMSISPDIMCSEIQNCLKNVHRKSRRLNSSMKIPRVANTLIERDMQDIKCILKEIICLLSESVHHICFDYEDSPEDCETNHESNKDIEILHLLLEEWAKMKKEKEHSTKSACLDKTSDSKGNQCESVDSDIDSIAKQEIVRNNIYKYLPQSIPIVPKIQNQNIVPILDAYERNMQSMSQNDPCDVAEMGNESQAIAIKSALESAGVPPNISEQICQMSLSGGTGITNIYYYVNSDTVRRIEQDDKNGGNLTKETEIIIEQQTVKKLNKSEKNKNDDAFSDIVVDFNNPSLKAETVENNDREENYAPILLNVQSSRESGSNINGSFRTLRRVKKAKFVENKECPSRKKV